MPRPNPVNPPAPQPKRLGRTKTARRPRSLPRPEKVAKYYAKRCLRIRNEITLSPMPHRGIKLLSLRKSVLAQVPRRSPRLRTPADSLYGLGHLPVLLLLLPVPLRDWVQRIQ